MKDATEVQSFPVVAMAERAVCIALALLCYSAVVADLAFDENSGYPSADPMWGREDRKLIADVRMLQL